VPWFFSLLFQDLEEGLDGCVLLGFGLTVTFQQVVHSSKTRDADCDEQSVQSGAPEWTFTRMHDLRYTRDTETNLDFANARYYTSQFGRFMGVDPLGGSVSDPQFLNAYAYVGNGPLSATDSSGLSIDSPTYGIDMPLVFNGGSGFSSGSQFRLPSFGPLSFSGVSFGGMFPGSNSGFGDSPAPGSLGLCGIIAGCGGSFDAAPPGPSHGQLAAEAAFNSAPGAGSSESLSVKVGNFLNSVCNSVCDWILNKNTANFFQGAGDALSFGVTGIINKITVADSVIDRTSGAYIGGAVTGTVVGIAIGPNKGIWFSGRGGMYSRGPQSFLIQR